MVGVNTVWSVIGLTSVGRACFGSDDKPTFSLCEGPQGPRLPPRFRISTEQEKLGIMASLKRSLERDPLAGNISNKVYVRSTKSGKVQKIVREVYLRQDIPCSSKLCRRCLAVAPSDASGRCETFSCLFRLLGEGKGMLTLVHSSTICALRCSRGDQCLPPGALPGP